MSYEHLPKSPKEAKLLGLNKYYTGKPCKSGHITYRYTRDRICKDCMVAKVKYSNTVGGNNKKRWAKKTKEQIDKINEQRRDYYQRTREVRLQEKKRAYEKLMQNPVWRQQNRERNAKWKRENNTIRLQEVRKRRSQLRLRTPAWLTSDDKWMIEEAYELARLRTRVMGFPWDVDHVLPLLGKNVSGLHVPQNLQVIPRSQNLSKNNKYLER